MNELVQRLNYIKTRRSTSWLTSSQNRGIAELIRLLRIPQTVNLYGGTGVGKTFLAWHLAELLDFDYYVNLNEFESSRALLSPRTIIDNCPESRTFHREALRSIRLRNVTHAVFISRKNIQDYTAFVELSMTGHDLEKVTENLSGLGVTGRKHIPNLWHLVNPYLLTIFDKTEIVS